MSRTERIIIAVLVLAAAAAFGLFMLAHVQRNVAKAERARHRTEADFAVTAYTIESVWQRELKQGTFTQAYLFIKPKGEPFNLSFGSLATDYSKDTRNRDALGKLLHPGQSISVMIDKAELAGALEDGLSLQLDRFFYDTNREVEIYRLDIDGRTVFTQDIRVPSSSSRGLVEHSLLRAGAAAVAAYLILSTIVKLLLRLKRKRSIA